MRGERITVAQQNIKEGNPQIHVPFQFKAYSHKKIWSRQHI